MSSPATSASCRGQESLVKLEGSHCHSLRCNSLLVKICKPLGNDQNVQHSESKKGLVTHVFSILGQGSSRKCYHCCSRFQSLLKWAARERESPMLQLHAVQDFPHLQLQSSHSLTRTFKDHLRVSFDLNGKPHDISLSCTTT